MIPPKAAPYSEGLGFGISRGLRLDVWVPGRRGMLRRRVILISVDYPDRSRQCRHGYVSSGDYAVYHREFGSRVPACGLGAYEPIA